MDASRNGSRELTAFQADLILNDLYGNDVMIALKMAKGFTNLDEGTNLKALFDDGIEVHNKLQARR